MEREPRDLDADALGQVKQVLQPRSGALLDFSAQTTLVPLAAVFGAAIVTPAFAWILQFQIPPFVLVPSRSLTTLSHLVR